MEDDKYTKIHRQKLNQWFATAICGNDILSSTFYVSGIAIIFAGIYAPLVLCLIVLVLFFYKSVYIEVVEALPTNGGAYNCLLNATSKSVAAVAGTTTILSYTATAVISGKEAIAYVQTAIAAIPIIPVTLILLFFFALLVISGIKDSAKVAFVIFSLHIVVLLWFVILGLGYPFYGHSYFMENLLYTKLLVPKWGGIFWALFFGFSASLLGVSGFESSANFVEEQQKGVFRKTLRNMLIGVAIFNPLITFIALNVLPFSSIVKNQDFLLSNTAQVIGGNIFKYIVVADAFLVLAGAVLTAFVGVSGLIYRMTSDGCFPNKLSTENKRGSYPFIVISFFILCISILLITKGNLLSLAGLYSIAFLSVMSLFACGNLLMRETRRELKRTYHAPLIFVVLALFATVIGIAGNIRIEPSNLRYFLIYFIPSVVIVFILLKLDIILRILLHYSKRYPMLYTLLYNRFQNLTDGTFVVFVHHINRLFQVLEYIDRNETGRDIYLIYCGIHHDKQDDKTFAQLKETLPALENAGAFPDFTIHMLYRNGEFGVEMIDSVAKDLKVNKNRILIGSIHDEHDFDYEELGGVRIIF